MGLVFLATFMVMGFALIYLRDFAPDAEEWAAEYGEGTHFETRLAHVHGALFALINVTVGILLPRMPGSERVRSVIAALVLAGMLMPLGILAEVLVSFPPVFVIIGGAALTAGTILAAVTWLRYRCFGQTDLEAETAGG